MIKAMREIAGSQQAHLEEVEDLRQRLTTIAKRLEAHNRLEEKQAYTWPSLLFDEQATFAHFVTAFGTNWKIFHRGLLN